MKTTILAAALLLLAGLVRVETQSGTSAKATVPRAALAEATATNRPPQPLLALKPSSTVIA
jgi:hypothetical protein